MKSRVTFTVSVKSEFGQTYEGRFEAKTKLSIRETLREEELTRIHLGADPLNASPLAKAIAGAIAYLTVHLTEAPSWFRDASNGLDIEDETVLISINNACVKAIDDERGSTISAAEKAQKELRESLPSLEK
jgi:hypothetical protein